MTNTPDHCKAPEVWLGVYLTEPASVSGDAKAKAEEPSRAPLPEDRRFMLGRNKYYGWKQQ